MWRKGMLSHCCWEFDLIQPLWKMIWRFLKNLGIKSPFVPVIPLQAYILSKPGLKRHMYPIVHCRTIYNSQNMEATQISIDELMNKVLVRIHSGILLSHKKESIESVLMMWMNLEPINRVKYVRKRKILFSTTHIWNLDKWY